MVYSKCGHEYKKKLKMTNQLKYYKFLVYLLIQKSIRKFRLKNIDETRNYLIEEINQNQLMSKRQINQNQLMSKKHNKVYSVLNFIQLLLILVSTVVDVFSFLLLLL